MTQTITGSGLGIYGSSIGMGGHATHGSAALGQGGESAYVNAVNGNLILRQSDGFLADLGFGFDLFQTYNSMGESGNSWCFNVQSRIELHGQTNQEGSYVIRIGEDGHRARFNWNTARRQYMPESGGTASLRSTANGWVYKEGNTKTTYEYDCSGQLQQISDQDNHHLKFYYADGHLTSIVSTSGRQQVSWTFRQGVLTDITAFSESQQIHHLHYDYDQYQRLQKVTRDLGEGKTYWITYEYVGDSNRISTVAQSDGTRLQIEYDAQGRVQKLVDGEGRITTYAYEQGHTTLTNGLGESWTYFYDERARLIAVEGPEHYRISYAYEGNQLSYITQGNQVWHYRYNDAGDCIYIKEPNGQITQRGFDSQHHLLWETAYELFDGEHHPIKPKTTRYTYDAQGHLRCVIGADGTVTEYRYTTEGLVASKRCYLHAAYDTAFLAKEEELTQEQMELWCAQQNPQQISLVDYRYDWRGQLSDETHYTHVTATGVGILDAQAIRTHTVYDAAGRLREKSTPSSGGWSTTYYLYDDLGRLTQTIDNRGNTQQISYDDAHQRIIQTDANGLQTITIYDRSGLLIATHYLDTRHDFGTVSYQYDAAGRVIAETGVDGLSTFYFYDAQGRVQVKVNKQGQLTEYRYNQEGLLVQTHQYAQRIATDDWLAHYPDVRTVMPHPHKKDNISQTIYNEYQQIAYTIDATGAVIGYTYDAAGKVISKTAYAQRLANYQPENLLSITSLAVVADVHDRRIYYYYGLNGQICAQIDAEGYAIEYLYNRLGEVVQTIRYTQPVTGSLNGDWELDRPGESWRDIHTYRFYDAQGQNIAEVDGEGYLIEYRYDANGRLIEHITYATAINEELELSAQTELATIRPPQHGNDRHSYYTYNDLGQLIEEKSPNGLITTYAYNEVGQLILKSRMDASTHAMRQQQYRYDALGRIIQQLDELGCAKLQQVALSVEDIERIWQQHSIAYTYDNSGLLSSKTDALNRTTRYVYNEYGQLLYTVSPQGSVTETRYNALNQIESICKYSAPLILKRLHTVTRQEIAVYLEHAKNEHFDETTWYEYNAIGQVIAQHTGAKGVVTSEYNAFGELERAMQVVDATHSKISSYHYDRRGLVQSQIEDEGGLNRITTRTYNAFGMLKEYLDGRGNTTRYTWNKRGEQTGIYNPKNRLKSIDYDAFGRIISETDNLQKQIKAYSYDDQNKKLTIKNSQTGSTVVTEFNAFGDKVTLIDGTKNSTTFIYDERGLLKRVDAPEHTSKTYHYDVAGQLEWQEDTGKHKIAYTYDAEGHVLTKTVDPQGLNLVTQYQYDAIGRQIKVTENKRVTEYTYNDQGLLVKSCVDPTGLNLVTEFNYDARGLLLRKTELNTKGLHRVTAYTWDNLERCTAKIEDPDGLQLTTRYQYDANDNLVCQTDARGNSTYSVYDVNNQCRYQINALGLVTEHVYSLNGDEIQTIKYARLINLPSTLTEQAIASLLVKDSKDQYTFRIWNGSGRLQYLTDALGYTTYYEYDANDNVIKISKYAVAASISDLKAGKQVEFDKSGMRCEYFAYDGLNQLRFHCNSLGEVIESRYDAHGQVIAEILYAEPVPLIDTIRDLAFFQQHCQSNAYNKITRYAYDQAGRLAAELSPRGVARAYVYNELNQVISCTRYASLLKLHAEELLTLDLLHSSKHDRSNYFIYDAAGRECYRISAEGQVVERVYDEVGNVIMQTTHAQRITTKNNTLAELNELFANERGARTSVYRYDAMGRLQEELNPQKLQTRYQYDSNGNVSQKTEANNAVWTYKYDALNQLVETYSPAVAVINSQRLTQIRSISTKTEYDSFGNVTCQIRDAEGSPQKRFYNYDALNRLVATIYPDVRVNKAGQAASATRQEVSKELVEAVKYNAFGEVLAKSNRAGHWQYFNYDLAGRLVCNVDAQGGVTHYQYDCFGQVTAKIRYATPLILEEYSNELLKKVIDNSKADRTESYFYDLDGQLVETLRDEVLTYTARNKTYSMLRPSTRLEYNAFGELIKTIKRIDAMHEAVTLMYYNQDGLQTAQIDAEGYLTTYDLNILGEVEQSTEFALRTANATVDGYSLPVGHAKDRVIRFTYDALGQLTSKTLKNATVSRLVNNKLETKNRDLTTYYTYDALGHLTETIDAQGNSAYCYYDGLGQLIAKVGPLTQQGRAATTYAYDAFGNLIQTYQWANGAQLTGNKELLLIGVSAFDRTTFAEFDAMGQVLSETDAMNHTVYYSYDEAGNLVRSFQTLSKANKASLIRDTRYVYDREHRLLQTITFKENNQQHIEEARYNVFGEVIAKGVNNKFHIHVDYDRLGHAWRSNTQGYYQIFVYDVADQVTQIVTASSAYIQGATDKRGDDLSQSYYEQCISFDQGDLHHRLQRQNNSYDALGHLLSQTREHTTDVTADDHLPTMIAATQLQTVDRWGNMLSYTNALQYTTYYEYNMLDQVIRQELPEVSCMDTQARRTRLKPVNHYAYDELGQLIALVDANQHMITKAYDAQGHVIRETDAKGIWRTKNYNLLGQLSSAVNELGGLTEYTYDRENRLTHVRLWNSHALLQEQSYTYDEAGQLLIQENGLKEKTTFTYDSLGNQVQRENARGAITSYQYDEYGRKSREIDTNKRQQSWNYDAHGHLLSHTDLNNRTTSYEYNTNGLVRHEYSTAGKDIYYWYQGDGLLIDYHDKASNEVAHYSYDAEGQLKSKISSRAHNQLGWLYETDFYTYDEQGRLAVVKRYSPDYVDDRIPSQDRVLFEVGYDYDKTGNIIHTGVFARPGEGRPGTASDVYYLYDENNRMILNKGTLQNGEIVLGAKGSRLQYDNAGNISDAVKYEQGVAHQYHYGYDEANQLQYSLKDGKKQQAKSYDLAGRVKEEHSFNPLGKQMQKTVFNYTNGLLSKQATYSAYGQEISQSTYEYDAVDNLKKMQITNNGGPSEKGGSRITHAYDYLAWDSDQQYRDWVTIENYNSKPTYGMSTRFYDQNGLLRRFEDPYVDEHNRSANIDYVYSSIDGLRTRFDKEGQTNYLTLSGKTIGDLHVDLLGNQELTIYGGFTPSSGEARGLGFQSSMDRMKQALNQMELMLQGYRISQVDSREPELPQNTLGSYTLNAGDTLVSIALQIYGDSSLWYLIADANGITDRDAVAGKDSQLYIGQRLMLPAATQGQHHTNATHRVLDANKMLGKANAQAVIPTPKPPKPKHQSIWGKVIVGIVCALVTGLTAGALAGASGSLMSAFSTGMAVLSGAAGVSLGTMAIGLTAGFVGSVVSQGVGNLLGVQEGIDVGGALLSGLTTAATMGIGHTLGKLEQFNALKNNLSTYNAKYFSAASAFEAMEQNAISQGLTVGLRRHQHFDWAQLGVTTLAGGVMGSKKGKEITNKLDAYDRDTGIIHRELDTMISSGATSLLSGSHFNAGQVLADSLGATLGNALMNKLAGPGLSPSLSLEGELKDWEYYKILNDWDENIELMTQDLQQPEPSVSYEYSSIPDAVQYSAIPAEENLCVISPDYWEEEVPVSVSTAQQTNSAPLYEYSPISGSAWQSTFLTPNNYCAISAQENYSAIPTHSNAKGESYTKVSDEASHAAILDYTAQEIYDIRAYKGIPGKMDAIMQLVGYELKSFRNVSNKEIGLNLDRLQEDVLTAHKVYPNVPVDLINAIIVLESKGQWNAVSSTGALGVMQMTGGNYCTDGKFNPFNTRDAIIYGAKLMSRFINKYGATQNGMSKVLVSYNQGGGYVNGLIKNYANDWLKYTNKEGQRYIIAINDILQNSRKIPGYFGEPRK